MSKRKFKSHDCISVVGCNSCYINNIKVTHKYFMGYDECGVFRKLPFVGKNTFGKSIISNYELASWSLLYNKLANRKRKKYKNKR